MNFDREEALRLMVEVGKFCVFRCFWYRLRAFWVSIWDKSIGRLVGSLAG